ncbi:MAG TPA: HNH endonuclease [Phycisphaerae bacterium]|nr:HNH endonuclease [Phycisphaerae bacterium]
MCGERPSTHVDHKEPLIDRPDLAFTRSNLQGLCDPCHHRKTADESRAVRQGKRLSPPSSSPSTSLPLPISSPSIASPAPSPPPPPSPGGTPHPGGLPPA